MYELRNLHNRDVGYNMIILHIITVECATINTLHITGDHINYKIQFIFKHL